jgi:integrating conjugative element protein (TIGR03757 family)
MSINVPRWLKASTSTLCLVFGLLTASEVQAEVWVFTTHLLPPLSGMERADRVFTLDAAQHDLSQLAFPHRGTEEEARRKAMAIIASPQGQAALQKIEQSSEALMTAWMQGIDQLPAVLVDREYVVYGGRSVDDALQRIEAYRRVE